MKWINSTSRESLHHLWAAEIQVQNSHNALLWSITHDPRQKDIREKIRVAPGNSTETLLWACGFQKIDDMYPDFSGKSVIDIGGGFGWIAPLLSDSVWEITVVDPVFREADIDILYEDDIWKVERQFQMFSEPPSPDLTPEILRLREKNLQEKKRLYNELLWWRNYESNGEHAHIKRNPSYGENLIWIESDSQDFAFVNYVITKETVNPKVFLQEAARVLKKWGKLILRDYHMSDTIIRLIRESFIMEEEDILQDENTVFLAVATKK